MGRKIKITKEVKQRILEAYSKGLNDSEVCLLSDISRATLYNYFRAHEKFREDCLLMKNNVKMHAKLNVARAVIEDKNLSASERYLARTVLPKQNKEDYPEEAVFIDDIPYEEDEIHYGGEE